ncbi:MAG: Rrf2 family transcriptional regulator [Ignavibacteriales bacterium]|nr:Rrf2 family transcriptional regulator [Ignavibacteriales bacterium]
MNSDRYLNAKEISNAIALPKEYVAKILQKLTYAEIVISQKGKGGGFKLLKSFDTIELKDIIDVFENSKDNKCLIGLSDNCEKQVCSFHHIWTMVKMIMFTTKLNEVNIKKI